MAKVVKSVQPAKPINLNDLLEDAQRERTGTNVSFDLLVEANGQILKERRDAAVGMCKNMLESFTGSVTSAVNNLRAIRKQEADQAAQVAKMDRAFRYFKATGIPYPMLGILAGGNTHRSYDANRFSEAVGIKMPDKDSPLWNVPADFVAVKD